jgi:transcriptional regulator with XRE-family HTH domain
VPRPQRDPDPRSLIGHFGAELRHLRTGADLSMNQLGDLLGCSGQWIGQVELGDATPSEEFSNDLDTYFQTGGSFPVSGSASRRPSAAASSSQASRDTWSWRRRRSPFAAS